MKTLLTIIFLLIPSITWADAALRFGLATSDRVNFSTPTTILNNTETSSFTYICWIRINTFTSGRNIFSKNAGAGNGGPSLTLNGTAELSASDNKSVTNANAISNTASLSLSTWYCVAMVYTSGDTQPRIYLGTQTTGMVELGYAGGATNGSGTTNDNDATFTLGNSAAASPVLAVQAGIGSMAAFNRALTLGEIQDWKFSPNAAGTALYSNIGYYGTSNQKDESGNGSVGTSSGLSAVAVGGPPIFFKGDKL